MTDLATHFHSKNVFITGHTGFKGAWLTQWLLSMGAHITGYSLPPLYQNSLFELLEHESKVNHIEGDIRDLDTLSSAIRDAQPEYIFHLAAQAIVSTSYDEPLATLHTNILGTANVLESCRHLDHPSTVMLVTSDKVYRNSEWCWGYRESDTLGGNDIYSSSKAATELVIQSYISSFFSSSDCPISIGIGRAGNVIGGGDWAQSRLIPDLYRSWHLKNPVEIRCPESTRPWQHVLEPLGGYLLFASRLSQDASLHGQAFNFGPSSVVSKSVMDVIYELSSRLTDSSFRHFTIQDSLPFDESSLLKLNCDKAMSALRWKSVLSFESTMDLVSDWYLAYLSDSSTIASITEAQICHYHSLLEKNGDT